MRYAIISDIHANLTALQCVLSDISKRHVDRIICLGDTMGYGPQPAETLELVYQVTECHLLGNHDAAVCGKLNPIIFCDSARKAVIKHREMLSGKAVKWLDSLPLSLKTPSFRCTHGDFTKPGAFRYIIAEKDAAPSFQATSEQLMFVGHTHLAAIYVIGASGVPHYLEPCDFVLESDKRYIVNPGTVGYPRSGLFESTYCIFDSEENSVVFRHIPFDHVAYNNALRAAGFDEIPWLRVRTADLSLPEVRKRLSFTRPMEDKDHLHETIRKIESTHRVQIKKYRTLIAAIALLSLAAGAFLTARIRRAHAEADLSLTIPAERMPLIQPSGNGLAQDNFLLPLPASLRSGEPIDGWRYALSDREQQRISAAARAAGNALLLSSDTPRQIVLESPLVRISGTGLENLRIAGRIRKLDGFTGTVSYQLQSYTEQPDGRLTPAKLEAFDVRGRTSEGPDFAAITRKIRLNRDTSHVRFRVKAEFTGALELYPPRLFGHDDTIPATQNDEGNIP
jgi:predicted phosphodiesterase